MCMSFEILSLQNLLPRLVKVMLAMVLSWIIPLFDRKQRSGDINGGCDSEEDQSRPSPSLVPVPVHIMAVATKERLPVIEYNSLLKRLGGGGEGGRYDGEEEDSLCAVCLRGINRSDEIRELSNCSHVFHRVCIDGWVDQGQITCPLCRSSLLIFPDHQNGKSIKCSAGDPWRRERMIYLFGEDLFCF